MNSLTYLEFLKKFPREEDAIQYYIKLRYDDQIVCNHCQSDKVYQRANNPKFFDCNACHNSFSIFKDTIFEKTTTDLRKWMYTIHSYLTKDKFSALQLQKEIDVTYKTAWRMVKQVKLELVDLHSKEKFIEGTQNTNIDVNFS